MKTRRIEIVGIRKHNSGAIIEKAVTSPLAKLWIAHPMRNSKQKIVFKPNQCDTDASDFNLWQGFRITKEAAQAFVDASPEVYNNQQQLFVKHIEEIWCQRDPEATKYCLNWLASVVQHPEKKLQTAILLQGEHGAGKGIIVMMLRDIIGRKYFTHFTKLSELFGSFNSEFFETCVLAQVDEVSLDRTSSGGRGSISRIKELITEDTHIVEEKFMPRMAMDSFINFIFISNRQHMMHVGSSERRFFALEAANTYAGATKESREYFEKLGKIHTPHKNMSECPWLLH